MATCKNPTQKTKTVRRVVQAGKSLKMKNILTRKLTEQEQSEILRNLFGFIIEGGIIYTDDGYEFYAMNPGANLETLAGIFKFHEEYFKERGNLEKTSEIKKVLGL